ncbi:hypothetical protein FQN54_007472 [Arachnomyces sp. PD_36]|nr:hypothetical protein FQN54_007472 [Arachnomyces sp. PD_36]
MGDNPGTGDRKDPFALLPTELVAEVVSGFTDPLDALRLRRVSKRWNEQLSSPAVFCRCFTGAGKTSGSPNGSKGEIARASMSDATLRKKLKRNHAAHTGRPYSRAFYPLPKSEFEYTTEVTPWIPVVAYSHHRIAWIEPTSQSVYVWCLVSGEKSKLLQDPDIEEKDEFSQVALSESMVVGVNSGMYCMVWKLGTTESAHFSLPRHFDGEFEQVTVEGDRVAITTDIGCVLIWDFQTKVTRTIDLGNLLLVSLHPGESLLTAAIAQYPSADKPTGSPRRFGWDDRLDSVKFRLLEFSEEKIQFSQHDEPEPRLPLKVPKPMDYLPWINCPPIRSALPLISQVKYNSSDEDYYSVSFDPTTRTPFSKVSRDSDQGFSAALDFNAPDFSVGTDLNEHGTSIIYSSGLRYTLTDSSSPSFIVRPPPSNSGKESATRPTEITAIEQSNPQMRDWWSSLGKYEEVVDIFGDEEIVGVVTPRGAVVWSFEEDLELDGETPEYRSLRKQRAQERARKRVAGGGWDPLQRCSPSQ